MHANILYFVVIGLSWAVNREITFQTKIKFVHSFNIEQAKQGMKRI